MVEIHDALSDYNSARDELSSSSDSSSEEKNSVENEFKTVKPRSLKKKKRKYNLTPEKHDSVKKQDLRNSPGSKC